MTPRDHRLAALATLPELELAESVRSGLPVAYLDDLLHLPGFSIREVERLVTPRRALLLRRARGQRLSPEESARLARLVRIVFAAREMLGTAARADAWLHQPNRALGGSTPLRLAESEPGARAVEAMLGRMPAFDRR
jgi:putative toxin-antitoxin system antitoxin component (TIGR02293 family)